MIIRRTSLLAVLAFSLAKLVLAQQLTISWNDVQRVAKTTPTLQVVVNSLLRPGSPIREQAYSAVRSLGAEYVRYVPWLPYPKLGIAELEPPANGQTS
jgi:hypothetical protein